MGLEPVLFTVPSITLRTGSQRAARSTPLCTSCWPVTGCMRLPNGELMCNCNNGRLTLTGCCAWALKKNSKSGCIKARVIRPFITINGSNRPLAVAAGLPALPDRAYPAMKPYCRQGFFHWWQPVPSHRAGSLPNSFPGAR